MDLYIYSRQSVVRVVHVKYQHKRANPRSEQVCVSECFSSPHTLYLEVRHLISLNDVEHTTTTHIYFNQGGKEVCYTREKVQPIKRWQGRGRVSARE